jgi:hypothetical protein
VDKEIGWQSKGSFIVAEDLIHLDGIDALFGSPISAS